MNKPTEQIFLKDTTDHQMAVMRDDVVSRHLRFRRPGTGCMGFDLLTWPGYLCFTGDMGTYVFRRLHDMFEFFRADRRDGTERLGINLSYWAEKVEAADRADGLMNYSPDRFRGRIAEWLDEAGASPALRQAVKDEVLSRANDGEHEARRAANEFEYQGFRFSDFCEVELQEYSYRFVWCCYAVAWGIREYDRARFAPQKTPAAA